MRIYWLMVNDIVQVYCFGIFLRERERESIYIYTTKWKINNFDFDNILERQIWSVPTTLWFHGQFIETVRLYQHLLCGVIMFS